MITAIEAKQLYRQPPYTIVEIEEQIKSRAAAAYFTCLENERLTPEILTKLREAGYEVAQNSHNTILSWEQAAA